MPKSRSQARVAETVQDENCQPREPTANFIAAIVTQNAIASDNAGMTEVLAEQAQSALVAPSTLYVDSAYVSGPIPQQARDEQRTVHGPASASPDRGKTFVVEAFDVTIAARSAVCPAGQRSTQCIRLEEASTGKSAFVSNGTARSAEPAPSALRASRPCSRIAP